MNAPTEALPITRGAAVWTGPGGGRAKRERWQWRRLVWALIYPRRGERITPTISGLLLIAVALGIGMAAYNTANNILFITLALLLGCLILSGVLSWLNFRGVVWRLQVQAPWRVDLSGGLTIEVANHKNLVPSYGLWFELTGVPGHENPEDEAHLVELGGRLDARGGELRIEETVRPTQRGRHTIRLVRVGSLFPFGFLRKRLSSDAVAEVIVWPAPLVYQKYPMATAVRGAGGQQAHRPGGGQDLHALRRYVAGDSVRAIHWKATARLRSLMVRQFAAETQESFVLSVETSSERWPRAEQGERMLSLAATLAEDLFQAGRLHAYRLNYQPPMVVRRSRDVEAFLDALALAHWTDEPMPRGAVGGGNPGDALITFVPEGHLGVAAYLHGHKTASA